MQSQPKISIIVPIYKVERYIRKCLDSIKNQNFKDWECILVDDGSPDKCGLICEEYSRIDNRFRVIHKENGGLSSARNAGIEIASAPFIGFVDPDDWIEPDMFAELYDLMIRYDADIVQVSLVNEYVGLSRKKPFVKRESVYDRKSLVRELFADKAIPNYCWIKLFKKEVITQLFPVGKVFEDIYMMNSWAENINRTVVSPKALYHYRRRRGSILNSDFASNRKEYFNACLERLKVLSKLEPDAISEREKTAYVWNAAINAAKTIARYEKDLKKGDMAVISISETLKNFRNPSLASLSPKMHFRASLLKNNPRMFAKLMRFVFKGDIHTKNRNHHLYE